MKSGEKNEYFYSAGKISKNNFQDIALKPVGNGKDILTQTFSLSHHLYEWPNSNDVTQESRSVCTRGLDKKGLKSLQKDLQSMSMKIKNYIKYGEF